MVVTDINADTAMQRPVDHGTDDASAVPAMYTPSQLKLLKIAVIVMGLILLLGFMAVIGRIVWLVNSAPKAPSEAAATGTAPLVPPIESIALPKGAIVRSISLSGSKLGVHYEGPDGAGIRIVDLQPGGRSFTLPIVEAGNEVSPGRAGQ